MIHFILRLILGGYWVCKMESFAGGGVRIIKSRICPASMFHPFWHMPVDYVYGPPHLKREQAEEARLDWCR